MSMEVLLLKVAWFTDFTETRKKNMFYFANGAIAKFDETEKLSIIALIFDFLPLLMDFF